MHESVALQQSLDVQSPLVAAHVEPVQMPFVVPGTSGQVSPEQQSESAPQISPCGTQAVAQWFVASQMFEQQSAACVQVAPVVPHARLQTPLRHEPMQHVPLLPPHDWPMFFEQPFGGAAVAHA